MIPLPTFHLRPNGDDEAGAGGETGGGRDDHVHQRGGPPAGNDAKSTDGLLTEEQERTVAAGLVTAFLCRHLLEDHGFDGLLAGRTHPLQRITTVDAPTIG
jgi:hypothetical protein